MRRVVAACVLIGLLSWCPGAARAQEREGTLDLAHSIAIALERSAMVHAAKEGVQGAEYGKRQARAALLPTFSAGYGYSHANEPPHSKVPLSALPGTPTGRMIYGAQDTYSWRLSLEQPLFTGWALTASYALAALGIDLANIEEKRAQLDVVVQVKEAYFTVLKSLKLQEVAAQRVAQIDEHLRVAQQFCAVGIVPRNEVLQAEVELAQARQDLIKSDNDVALAKSRFNTVLRRELDRPVSLEDTLAPASFGKALEECLETGRRQRPEMQEVQKRIEMAGQEVKRARSGFYPSLSFVFNYQRQGDRYYTKGNDYRDAETWEALTAMNWTFWEWGKTHYAVKESQVRVRQLEDAEIEVGDAVNLEIKAAFLRLQEAEKNVAVAQAAIVQAEENFRLNQQRYQEQVGRTTDVIDAQTLLSHARTNYYNALSDQAIARARLERAMGAEG